MLEILILELSKNNREGKEIIIILFLIVIAKAIENIKANEKNNRGDNKE